MKHVCDNIRKISWETNVCGLKPDKLTSLATLLAMYLHVNFAYLAVRQLQVLLYCILEKSTFATSIIPSSVHSAA